MTRAYFASEAPHVVSCIESVDKARDEGREYVGSYLIGALIMDMIRDLDFDWFLYLKTGREYRDGNC